MLALGLLGTGHCVGMCGPLVLALPGSTGRVAPHLAYHLGRCATYVAVGALLGGLGAGAVSLAGDGGAAGGGDAGMATVARVQVALSLFAALFLLAFGLVRLGVIPEPRFMEGASPSRLPGFARVVGRAARSRSALASLPAGLALGLLPCGLSYAAFARAFAAGGAAEGALLVAAFAAGTVPGLLAVGTVASGFARRHRKLSDLLSGVVMIGMAASLGVDALLALG